ncbi:hypothetical protein C2E23DRAFT_429875 [Lenzites betulinus]|nr:hypothetical protein C2E23DRAFT_429875 [Lenzites betulinus]
MITPSPRKMQGHILVSSSLVLFALLSQTDSMSPAPLSALLRLPVRQNMALITFSPAVHTTAKQHPPAGIGFKIQGVQSSLRHTRACILVRNYFCGCTPSRCDVHGRPKLRTSVYDTRGTRPSVILGQPVSPQLPRFDVYRVRLQPLQFPANVRTNG